MLKLLKYEWKACARTCLPLYGVLILMSLISRILYVIPKNASPVSYTHLTLPTILRV